MHMINVQNEYPMIYLQYDTNTPEGQADMIGYVQPGTLRVKDGRALPLVAGDATLVEGLVPDAAVLIKAVAPLPMRDDLAQQACTCSAVAAATGMRVCSDCTQRAPVPAGGCEHGQCPSNLPMEEILEREQATYNQLYAAHCCYHVLHCCGTGRRSRAFWTCCAGQPAAWTSWSTCSCRPCWAAASRRRHHLRHCRRSRRRCPPAWQHSGPLQAAPRPNGVVRVAETLDDPHVCHTAGLYVVMRLVVLALMGAMGHLAWSVAQSVRAAPGRSVRVRPTDAQRRAWAAAALKAALATGACVCRHER